MRVGTQQTINVLANDEVRFGAALAKNNTFSRIELLDAKGKVVREYKDAYATYRLSADGRSIVVDARTPFAGYTLAEPGNVVFNTGRQGFTPVVRYRAITPEGKISNVGYLQPKLYR